jgi:hypothetical protein
MPATDELQLFNFEYNFERAVESILDAGGYSARTFIQGSRATLPESRIEITFASGQAINQALYPLDPSQEVYDFFDGRLSLRIVTVRDAETGPSLTPGVGPMHEEWAAAVRMLLQERREPFTATNLPYYAVKTIRQIGTQRDLDPRWMEDFTRIDFLIQFGIRSQAWPAT